MKLILNCVWWNVSSSIGFWIGGFPRCFLWHLKSRIGSVWVFFFNLNEVIFFVYAGLYGLWQHFCWFIRYPQNEEGSDHLHSHVSVSSRAFTSCYYCGGGWLLIFYIFWQHAHSHRQIGSEYQMVVYIFMFAWFLLFLFIAIYWENH